VFQRLLASVAVLSLSILVASPSAALTSFDNLFVFGDSIVDTGNTQTLILAATGGATDVTPAAFGYFDGRFTNGINPADVLNLAVEGTNADGSLAGGDNYAFGGARARADADIVPDLSIQVSTYLGNTGGVAGPSSLYMINVGGNDVRDIVLGGLSGPARQAVIDAAVLAISTSVSSLQSAGAQNILFVGVGDVGAIPEILALGGSAPADGRAASEDMNTAIQAALPGSVQFFDTIALFDAVLADPAAFGLPPGLNITEDCLTSGVANPGGPPTCTDFAFFDNVHPTTQVLQLLGAELVLAVPEPGTAWLVSIGLVGIGVRRRRARAA
jgi:phospholipase/lecithinase/hemolysin